MSTNTRRDLLVKAGAGLGAIGLGGGFLLGREGLGATAAEAAGTPVPAAATPAVPVRLPAAKT